MRTRNLAKLTPKTIKLSEVNVNKPIQVVLPFVDYIELKTFTARYNTTISEVVRNLVKEHLEAVALNELKN